MKSHDLARKLLELPDLEIAAVIDETTLDQYPEGVLDGMPTTPTKVQAMHDAIFVEGLDDPQPGIVITLTAPDLVDA